jgi:hypothetical protein
MEVTMSIASSFEPYDREKVFYDLETWQSMFEEAVKGNPDLADHLAWLLYRVIRELADRKKGRKRVVNTMKLGIEWLYQFTDAGKLSFDAFLYYLEGVLVPSDMPEEVMKGVIDRGEATATRISAEDANADRAKKRKPNKRGKRRKGQQP